MKKTVNKVNELISKVSLSSARVGAGLISRWGWYQPRVPKRISK